MHIFRCAHIIPCPLLKIEVIEVVLSFEQEKELEVLKQKHKIELENIRKERTEAEHKMKLEEFDKLLELAKAGITNIGGV